MGEDRGEADGEGAGEERRISTTASVIMLVVIGAAFVYLGVTLVLFAVYAFGRDSTLLGLGALVLGVLFIGGPVAVIVSQTRALFRRRG